MELELDRERRAREINARLWRSQGQEPPEEPEFEFPKRKPRSAAAKRARELQEAAICGESAA